MPFWIFKVKDLSRYPDVFGRTYVYNNTHSCRVADGDLFLYLSTQGNRYEFIGAGQIAGVPVARLANEDERRNGAGGFNTKIRAVYTAHLGGVTLFSAPLTLSSTTETGRANRDTLGISTALHWGRSIISISERFYDAVLQLSADHELLPAGQPIGSYEAPSVEDMQQVEEWGESATSVEQILTVMELSMAGLPVRRRKQLAYAVARNGRISRMVKEQAGYRCIKCGVVGFPKRGGGRYAEVHHVLELSRGGADLPMNLVCVCPTCHRILHYGVSPGV